MKKVYNPTDKEIKVQIKGVVYVAPAKGYATNVKPEHAEHWKNHIHQFVQVMDETGVVLETTVSTSGSIATTFEEEEKAEVKEEVKPKKGRKPSK